VVLVQVAGDVHAEEGLEVEHLRVVRRDERLLPDRRGAVEACDSGGTGLGLPSVLFTWWAGNI
jgi:hypothetical protein